jgi:hypothetical protein
MMNEAGNGLDPDVADALVHPEIRKQARAIQARLSQDLSFAALWKRLDQAERDRDRMMNALQLVRDEIGRGKITATPRHKTLINRALSRLHPVRPATPSIESEIAVLNQGSVG